MAIGNDEIENRFRTHGGDVGVAAQHEAMQGAFIAFAGYLDTVLPDGRSKDVAFDQLKTTSMWSHFALAELAPIADPALSVRSRPVPVPVPPRRSVPQ